MCLIRITAQTCKTGRPRVMVTIGIEISGKASRSYSAECMVNPAFCTVFFPFGNAVIYDSQQPCIRNSHNRTYLTAVARCRHKIAIHQCCALIRTVTLRPDGPLEVPQQAKCPLHSHSGELSPAFIGAQYEQPHISSRSTEIAADTGFCIAITKPA